MDSARTARGADPAAVGPYLADVLADPRWRACQVELISGGKSNLTYLVESPAGVVVLRRPPLGNVLPTAHDMEREYRVITALRDTPVPVPTTLHLCPDGRVLGAPFYLMAKVEGHIARSELPPGYADTAADRRRIGESLLEVLAALHAVDFEAVGLGDFGRPDGYLARQVRRWSQQWERSRTQELPGLDRLAADLDAALPTRSDNALVHGDYRLDNTLLDPRVPGRIAAVLDWEMSTLGDPLADVGLLLVYWSDPGDGAERAAALVVPSATVLPGFPTRAQVAELYAELTGRDLSTLPWYVAFAFFKLAVVCAGIAARHRAGAMVGEGFDDIGNRVAPLVDLGRATLADHALY